jgi:hypothetical protein
LLAQLVILRQILVKKHVEGISFYGQLLTAVAQIIKIFYFPFTILSEYWICWLEYILTAGICVYIMFVFRVHQRLSSPKEENKYDWRILIAIAVVLAVISNYEKDQKFEYS